LVRACAQSYVQHPGDRDCVSLGDVTFATLPARTELQARGGINVLTGRGGFRAGLAFPGGLVMIAGPNGDELDTANGNDVIVGARRADQTHFRRCTRS
jgi:hypothetical protein